MHKIFWILAGLAFTYSNYAYAKMAFHLSNLQNTLTMAGVTVPQDNPWIPVISSAIALGFAIIAFLRERKK